MSYDYYDVLPSYIFSSMVDIDQEANLIIDNRIGLVIGAWEKEKLNVHISVELLEYYISKGNNNMSKLSSDIKKIFNPDNIILSYDKVLKWTEVFMLASPNKQAYISIGHIETNKIELRVPLIAEEKGTNTNTYDETK